MVRDRPRAGFIRVFYRLYRAALRHQDRCQRSHLAGSALGPTGESILESISATRDPHHGRCSDTGTRRTGGQPTSAGTRSRSRVVPFGSPTAGRELFCNGLLYLPIAELKKEADWLTRADVLIGTLAADPSLRGTLDALSLGLAGVQRKEVALAGSHDDHGR